MKKRTEMRKKRITRNNQMPHLKNQAKRRLKYLPRSATLKTPKRRIKSLKKAKSHQKANSHLKNQAKAQQVQKKKMTETFNFLTFFSLLKSFIWLSDIFLSLTDYRSLLLDMRCICFEVKRLSKESTVIKVSLGFEERMRLFSCCLLLK